MKPILTLSFLCSFLPSYAQNAYTFEHGQSPYVELTDPVPCDFNSQADDLLEELEGETFILYGLPHTGTATYPIAIGGHGFLRLENDTALVILDGLFTNIVAVDSMSNVSYVITGSSGALVLTVQWENIRFANGPVDSYLNYQLRLYQATGVVEVHTGPNSGSAMDYTSASGPNCGVFHSPQDFSGCYGKLWVELDANDPTLDSVPNYDFDALHNLPAPNTLYRFVPRSSVVAVPDRSPFATSLDARYDAGTEQLFVHLRPEQGTGRLLLIDASGRPVRSWAAPSGNTWFPVAGLAPGAYVLEYRSGSTSTTWRFVR